MAKIKAGLLSLRDLFATAWWIFLIAGMGFVVAYQFVEPAPPRHVVMTSGGESGAYYHFAKRYAALLARDGITLEILPSEGSLQNLQRLQAGEDGDAQEHSQHPGKAAAHGDGHHHPEAGDAGGIAQDLGAQDIPVKLLKHQDKDDEAFVSNIF